MLSLQVAILLLTSSSLQQVEDADNSTYYTPDVPENANIIDVEVSTIKTSSEPEMHRVDNEKPPVKLTAIQNTIMNQVLSVYALDDAEEALCRNHSRKFKSALRSFTPWALKMFDASAKLQNGIFSGNLMEFGSFRQCLEVHAETQYGPVRGKQCGLKITPSEDLIHSILMYKNISEKHYEAVRPVFDVILMIWTVCVPESCETKDVLRHFNKTILKFSKGLDLTVGLDDINCYSSADEIGFNGEALATLLLIASIIGINIVCSAFLYRRKGLQSKIVRSFSIKSNIKSFLHSAKNPHNLECLDGIRFLSICYVVLGHRYIFMLVFPAANGLDIIDWLHEVPSAVIIGGPLTVDTFLTVAAVLVTFHLLNYLEQGKKFNLLGFYMLRYLRLVHLSALYVLIFATLLPFFGSGPLWKVGTQALQGSCRRYWWSSILLLQGYINPGDFCIVPTWYLTCEWVYYLISPFYIRLLHSAPKFGIVAMLGTYSLSTFITFYLSQSYGFSPADLANVQLVDKDYFTKFYILPHVRIGPYIIGMCLGYILFQTRNVKIQFNQYVVALLWLTSLTIIGTVLFGHSIFEQPEYERGLDVFVFLAFSRSAWSLSLAWIIFACTKGFGGYVNEFLSWTPLCVLSKLNYGIFHSHFLIQMSINANRRLPQYFSNFDMVYQFFGDIVLAMVASFFTLIFIEYPVSNLLKQRT